MQVKLIDSPQDPVRIAFVHVFHKRPGMKNNDGSTSPDKFETTAILKPGGDNEKKVKAAIAAVAKEAYGDNWGTMYKEEFADDQRGLRKGDLKKSQDGVIYDGFEGNTYVVARNVKRPTVVDRDRSPLTEEDGRPYAGCYSTVHIDVWALTKRGVKKRIVTDLTGLQFSRDGDAFGGGSVPAKPDDFEDLSVGDGDTGSADREMAGADNEDPFA
jgi:hypothetical protein